MTRFRASAGKALRLEFPSLGDLGEMASYMFAAPSAEPRARAPLWDDCAAMRPANCTEVVAFTASGMTLRRVSGATSEVALNDQTALQALFEGFDAAYVDISGLPYEVWAPLVRAGLQAVTEFHAVYVEPGTYRKHPNPTALVDFFLSEDMRGVAPLPGFAKLRGPKEETEALLVALLGFEGRRASHIANALDPVPMVVPVVGVPGFRIEYPQITYASNHSFINDFASHANVRYAAAYSPFEAFDVLNDIHRDNGDRYMYIAPLGTRPHALGAICYVLRNPDHTELMYDNPVPVAGGTTGLGAMHIYTLKPSYVVA